MTRTPAQPVPAQVSQPAARDAAALGAAACSLKMQAAGVTQTPAAQFRVREPELMMPASVRLARETKPAPVQAASAWAPRAPVQMLMELVSTMVVPTVRALKEPARMVQV